MTISNIVHSIRNIMRKRSWSRWGCTENFPNDLAYFLKVFDSMEEEKEAENVKYKSPLPEEIRWRNWAKDEEGITGDELMDLLMKKS